MDDLSLVQSESQFIDGNKGEIVTKLREGYWLRYDKKVDMLPIKFDTNYVSNLLQNMASLFESKYLSTNNS